MTKPTTTSNEPARQGRPPKAAIAARKPGGRVALGRPPGEAARLQEFKARLMGTTGEKIMTTLIRKAMDDDDKDQFAALKFCAERILPMSAFDAAKNSNSTPQVTINISGLSDTKQVYGQDKEGIIDV
tara:strand:+ start:275 stop:658 length:384 start_codon:yes stop_codon:yes gene_type:complete